MTALLAERLQSGLDGVAVSSILVAHHDKAHSWFAPRSQLSRNALFQILLAFMFYAPERQTRKQPVKEHVQQISH